MKTNPRDVNTGARFKRAISKCIIIRFAIAGTNVIATATDHISGYYRQLFGPICLPVFKLIIRLLNGRDRERERERERAIPYLIYGPASLFLDALL